MTPARVRLPLWEQWSPRVLPEQAQPGCTKCSRGGTGEFAPSREAGAFINILNDHLSSSADVLVVVGSPTNDEIQSGRPFSGVTHRHIEKAAHNALKGSGLTHALAYAIRCGGNELVPKEVQAAATACAPHLRADIAQARPKRLVVVGSAATRSITGSWMDTARIRRAWTFVDGVPALFVMGAAQALRNTFLSQVFEADLLWALTAPLPTMPTGTTKILSTALEVDLWVRGLKPGVPTSIDVEHVNSAWEGAFRLLCIGMCQDPTAPVVIPAHVVEQAADTLRAWMQDPRQHKVNQNIKHDRHVLYRVLGVDLTGIVGDTMLASRLREPEAPAGLGPQSWLVGFGGYKEAAKAASTAASDKDGEEARGSARFAKMPVEDLYAYNGRDTAATILLHRHQQAHAKAKSLITYRNLIGPVFDALAHVERNGMLVSADNVRAYDAWLKVREEKAKTDLAAIPEVPTGFNPGSPLQVGALLFKTLGLPSTKKTATGASSTDRDSLLALVGKHPIINILLELALVRKQISTYGLPMLENVSPLDGRIHTTFNLVRTGRLSSANPNCQNITSSETPGDEGSWARGCFVAPPGHKLVELDMSQMELRISAMLANDRSMAKMFESGHDYHTATAALIFNTIPSAVIKEQRKAAKSINFGLIYGQTSFGLSKTLGISEKKAQGYMDTLFSKLPKLNAWRNKQIATSQVTGDIEAEWNPEGSGLGWYFRRAAWGLGEIGNDRAAATTRKHWENVALNFPVQCLANCFSLASLVDLVRWTLDEAPDVKVVMTVHDSIVLECPTGRVDEVIKEAHATMTKWPAGCVSLKVDAAVGDNWGAMVPYPIK